jgi:hypothetical protein
MTGEPEAALSAALSYARRGWPVFPCQPDCKAPATRHGFRDATTEPGQITRWWNGQPGANVAIATGLPGPDVLDVDQHGPAGTGYPACRRLHTAGLLEGAGTVVATPSGGLHVYFTGSSGQPCGRLVGQHLDFRSAGGYVLVPPSRVGTRRYRLLRSQLAAGSLDWQAVVRLLEPHPARSCSRQAGELNALIGWVARLEPGNRNCGLFWAACRMVEAGQEQLLGDLAAAAAATGLPISEVNRTIASARRTITGQRLSHACTRPSESAGAT